MAGSRKEYELLMKLTAALGPNFNSAFQTALNTTKKLQSSLQSVKKVQGDISAYKKTQDAIAATQKSVKGLETRHGDLQTKLTATIAKEKELQKALANSKKATGENTAEYARLESELKETQDQKRKLAEQVKKTATEIDNSNRKIDEQEKQLTELSKELKAAGVNTGQLTQENEKLQKAYDRVKQSQEDIARVNQLINENKEAISATRSELTKTIGTVAAVGAAFSVPIKGAMAFETSMAEVAKVVDWIGNGNDATAEQIQQYNELSDGIYDLTRQIPMTAKEFATITAAAGQANVALDNAGLLNFASDAAKMGIAFDISAEQAGQFMAQWRTAFGMAQSEVVALSDVINYLGNTTPATAAQISNVVTRIGPLGEVAGLTSKDLAALSAAIVGVGIDESVAATGIKNLMLDMTKGTAATKNMHGVLASMGMSATALAERMQTDATGAIMDFMRAIRQLPEAEQAAALTTYFGQESVAAISPLLSNLDNLEAQFYKVADASLYAGSMEAEYAARAATSENSLALLMNAVKELSDTFGKIFVPGAEGGMQAITELVYKVTDFVKENPELIKTLVKVAASFAGLKIAGLGAKLGFLEIKDGVLNVQKVFALFKGNLAESAAAAATGGGKIATMGRTLTGYFGGVKDALGGVGKSVDALTGGGLSKLTGLFSKVGGGISSGISDGVLKHLGGLNNKLTGAFGGIGDRLTGLFGGIGQKIANGPLGKLGGVFQGLGKTAGAVLGGPLQGLGGLFGGLFGKVMPIIMVLSALSLLFLKLSGEDISGFIEPLKEAFEQAKPVLASAMEQFKDLGAKLLPLLIDTAKQLAPLLGDIVAKIMPLVLELIKQIVPLLVQVIGDVLPVILNIIGQLAPLLTKIITDILPIVLTLLETLLPIISQLIKDILPIVVSVLEALMPIITDIIQAVLPVLMSILEALMPVIQVLAELFGKVLGAAIEGLKPIIDAFMTYLKGIIDFITGVFTGDWGKAWDGVKNIFKGVVDGLVGVFKLPLNMIIEGINSFLGGLNKLEIPDWVPGVGGKGINIPLIPKLEKGSDYTPDTFIAGDVNGKGGELITNARGRKVFTAAETSTIFEHIQLANAINHIAPSVVTPDAGATVAAPLTVMVEPHSDGSPTFVYSPTIQTSGGEPQNMAEIERLLNAHGETMFDQFRTFLRQQRDDERRMQYA